MKNIKEWFFSISMVIIAVMIIGFLSSCSTSKQVTKTESSYDSTHIKSLTDSIAVLSGQVSHLENMIKELEYGQVIFDTTDCPEIIIPDCPAMLNKDSVQRLVTDLNNTIKGLNNKVKINADGSKEFSGRLKSYVYQVEKQSKTIFEQQSYINYLHIRNAADMANVVASTSVKQVDKESNFLSGIGFTIMLFLIGLVVGIVIGYRIRKKLSLL